VPLTAATTELLREHLADHRAAPIPLPRCSALALRPAKPTGVRATDTEGRRIVPTATEALAALSPDEARGSLAVLEFTVMNGGPNDGPIEFSDRLPSQLRMDSAVAGSGDCVTTPRRVACTISALGVGQTAPVDIVVRPSTVGGATPTPRRVAPAQGTVDPNVQTNTARVTVTVSPAPPAAACQVPRLTGSAPPLARRVLGLLDAASAK